jgi:uncharacterized GH25 family protein
MKAVVAVVALLAMPVPAFAHDFWVERAGDSLVVRYGHRGGELLPVDPGKLKVIRCSDGTGTPRDVTRSAVFSVTDARFAGPCSIASAFNDGGYWSLTPDGEVNLPRNQTENVVKAWASRQYAKWVEAKSPASRTVLGDELELVPASDLTKTREGDKITLRLVSSGQPVPDATIAIDHRPIGETDSKGEVRLRLHKAGIESISASIRRPHPTPEADVDVLEASLTFEVSK